MNRLITLFVTLFESDPRWWVRVAGAAGLGLALDVVFVIKAWGSLPSRAMIVALVGFPASMAVAGVLLATADATRWRIRAGQRVGILSRVLFGAGIWSLLVWAIVIIPVGTALAILLGSMTWNRPAG